MALTLADIARWDSSAIHDVSEALAKRGASADEVRGGLTKLPLIASWQGSGGDAARASLDKLSAYLAAHGEEMAKVSSATGSAADEVDRCKSALQRINSDAVHEGFNIDPATGEVTPAEQEHGRRSDLRTSASGPRNTNQATAGGCERRGRGSGPGHHHDR